MPQVAWPHRKEGYRQLVSKCRSMVIEGTTGRGRPQRTWDQVVHNDLQHLHLKKEFAQERDGWRDAIKKTPSMLAWKGH